MANLVELASILGLGGLIGALIALIAAGKTFADHLAKLAGTIDKVLKDPRNSDLATLAIEARIVEKDARNLLGLLKQIFKR